MPNVMMGRDGKKSVVSEWTTNRGQEDSMLGNLEESPSKLNFEEQNLKRVSERPKVRFCL